VPEPRLTPWWPVALDTFTPGRCDRANTMWAWVEGMHVAWLQLSNLSIIVGRPVLALPTSTAGPLSSSTVHSTGMHRLASLSCARR
jgi:hypothetical protein